MAKRRGGEVAEVEAEVEAEAEEGGSDKDAAVGVEDEGAKATCAGGRDAEAVGERSVVAHIGGGTF